MPDPIRILEVLILSAAAAASVVLVFGWPWRAPNRWRSGMGGVLGFGAGLSAGCWLVGVSPNWPLREDQDRLLGVLLPAVILVEFASAVLGRAARLLSRVSRVAIATFAAPILLYGSSYISDPSGPGSSDWSFPIAVLILAGLAGGLAAFWGALVLLASRAGSRTVPLALAIACAGSAVSVMLSGYASGGQLGLVIAAALLGAVLGSLALRGMPETVGLTGVGVVSLFAVLVMGRFFGRLSTTNAALLFFSPLLAWATEFSPVRRRGIVVRGIVGVVAAAIPVALALLLAQRQFAADMSRTAAGPTEPSVEDYSTFGK